MPHPPYPDDDICPECGGEGVVYDCQDEIGCVDPEGGCDLCARRCDWCRPRHRRAEQDDGLPDEQQEWRDFDADC